MLPGLITAGAIAAVAFGCTGAASGSDLSRQGCQGRQATPIPLAATVEDAETPSSPVAPAGGSWRTNRDKYIVDPSSIGPGLPRDAIPPIYNPRFESLDDASLWLEDDDMVGVVELEWDTRIYPLRILVWHEVVNDQIGGIPLLVTFCPLCDTLLAFDRRVEGRSLVFGVSVKLRRENLIMWDHETESWWQQISGTALVGDLAGQQLQFLPIRTILWGEARRSLANARVLSRKAGFSEDEAHFYTLKVCPTEYSAILPLWTGGPTSDALADHERVVGLSLAGGVAYPMSALAEQRVVNDVADGLTVVLFYSVERCAAILPSLGAETVDTASVYSRIVGGRTLSFYLDQDKILDRETSSIWSPAGLALSGPLQGTRLGTLPHTTAFWFAWVGFNPDTELRFRQ